MFVLCDAMGEEDAILNHSPQSLTPEEFLDLCQKAQAEVLPRFAHFSEVALHNTKKVLGAFQTHRLSDAHFAGTTGYGYDDTGRDTLDRIYADVFGAQDALVRMQMVSGTHALACALFAVVEPGQTLVSATGAPYDTLQGVIGNGKETPGSLCKLGVKYREVALTPDGRPDEAAIEAAVQAPDVGAVFLQRSRGYSDRQALSMGDLARLIARIKAVNPDVHVLVDNCYGEFVETREPCDVGADLIAGSLIKNPGGGLALTGGYIAGKHLLVERAAARLTAPGIGRHAGASLGQTRAMMQGLFLAPHTVSQALMTATFCASLLQKLGFEVDPLPLSERFDIIQRIRFGAPEPLLRFCQGVQAASPVDSFAVPEPWDMPGYEDPVVMAAGTFVQGGSLELSCDAPMRAPYDAFLQGGLTFEAGRLAIESAARSLLL